MTDLRQAAQAVVDRWDSLSWSWSEKTPTADLIAALRKALEQPEQEPAAQWDKPSASFDEWWDGDYDDLANPYHTGTPAYWAWAGWKAAQRKWVGLTEEEILDLFDVNNVYGSKWIEFARTVEAKLKAKND